MRAAPLLLLLACTSGPNDSNDPADTADTGPVDTGLLPGEVVLGQTCPLADSIGTLGLQPASGSAWISGQLYDRPNPWYGEPTLTTATCAFHTFDANACGTCPSGDVCGQAGECTKQPRALTDVHVELTRDGATVSFDADPTGGYLYGDAAGPDTSAYALTATFAGQSITLPELRLADPTLAVVVRTEGGYDAPGALDATWTPPTDGGLLTTTIPINHHAGGPTFTRCEAPASAGAFHADAAMVDPLALITGLEFQGVDHVNVAAAQTALGCVDVRFGGTTAWVWEP